MGDGMDAVQQSFRGPSQQENASKTPGKRRSTAPNARMCPLVRNGMRVLGGTSVAGPTHLIPGLVAWWNLRRIPTCPTHPATVRRATVRSPVHPCPKPSSRPWSAASASRPARPAASGWRWNGSCTSCAAPAPRHTRTARGGLRRTADRAPELGAHRRTRRPAGAELAARRLPDGVHRVPSPPTWPPYARPSPSTASASSASATTPGTRPRRFLHEPRYDAMEACLDRTGPAGRAMMCTSASVQVCLDAGHEEPGPLGHGRRWRLAHLLGAGPGGRLRQLPARRGRAHRLALHPAGCCGRRSAPAGRGGPAAGRRPAHRLGPARRWTRR